MKPALTACSIPFSCPPWSSVCDVFLSPQVVHKAVLDVAETGTEAAAATGVIGGIRKAVLPAVCFNRPFLIVIYHTSAQSILFMAKVNNPK